MAGLTYEGFIPSTYEEISERIKVRLNAYNPGFDFSPESPDGQLIDIFSFELSQAWSELGLVYNSYNPAVATGQALRNLGLITGISRDSATRSMAEVDLAGTAQTLVPAGSVVADADGNEFYTTISAVLPTSVDVIAVIAGQIPVPIGSITTIKSTVVGWSSVSQPAAGYEGTLAITDLAFRNLRNRTTMRNFTSVADTMVARLFELGIQQATAQNNDSSTVPLPDGTPANTIHVTVGEVGDVSDQEIAEVILATKGLGCATYGSTSVDVVDTQGYTHTISFTRATEIPIFMSINVTYLTNDTAGAVEAMKDDLAASINALLAGEDVINSRLYSSITPYGKAQVNSLQVGRSLGTLTGNNVSLLPTEYGSCDIGNIDITST